MKKHFTLAAMAAFALTACGQSGTSDLDKISKNYMKGEVHASKPFNYKEASGNEAFLAKMKARLDEAGGTYDKFAFDEKLNGYHLQNYAFNEYEVSLTIADVYLYGLHPDAEALMIEVAANPEVMNEDAFPSEAFKDIDYLFDAIRVSGLSLESEEFNLAVENAEILDADITIMEFGEEVFPISSYMTSGSGISIFGQDEEFNITAKIAEFRQTTDQEGKGEAIYKDLSLNMTPIEEMDADEMPEIVRDLPVVSSFIDKGFGYHIDKIAIKGKISPKIVQHLAVLEDIEEGDFKLDFMRGENLINIDHAYAENFAVNFGDYKIMSVDAYRADDVKFDGFWPQSFRLSEENVVYDLTPFVEQFSELEGEESVEAELAEVMPFFDYMKEHKLTKFITDVEFHYEHDEKTHKMHAHYYYGIKDMASLRLEIGFSDVNVSAYEALSQNAENLNPDDILKDLPGQFDFITLTLEDKKMLEHGFALAGIEAGFDSKGGRDMAAGFILIGGNEAKKNGFGFAKDYISNFSNWIRKGGTVSFTIKGKQDGLKFSDLALLEDLDEQEDPTAVLQELFTFESTHKSAK